MRTLAHVTHEAVHKIGGIGTVLEGLITARAYHEGVDRTVLVGPLFSVEGDATTRLGRGGEVYYSQRDHRRDHAAAHALRDVEQRYGVEIIYGRRPFKAVDTGFESAPEVLLIAVWHAQPGPLKYLKFRLYEAYNIASDRYESVWEYEQYVRLAMPALEALRAIGACGGADQQCVVVAHEFMGMPTALAAKLFPEFGCKAVFQAHEVAAVRKIVEEHPCHDTMFYNVLRRAPREGLYLEDVFGSQDGYFKHPLVKAARHCDNILAVGDDVVEELRFLSPQFKEAPISLTYNGIPAYRSTAEEDTASKRRLQVYAENLLGFCPDFVFTHVTRLVRSKGLWRDLEVMEHIERAFRADGRTAVLFVLSTEMGGPRRPADVLRMEREYGWPVAHREGLPDLSGGEAAYYVGVQAFNARSRQCKVIFVNQFGFDREHCGLRMPEDVQFWDIRRGSDLEFGQSVYEPFGIAQIEALSFGSICVMSAVCGCAGFVRRVTDNRPGPNVIVVDYTHLDRSVADVRDLLKLTAADRLRVERHVAQEAARQILAALPTTPVQSAALLDRGHEIARRMSWDVIARDYFLPAIEFALKR